jgi:cell division protein ZapA (FtsZ GTPase activity inhibitor)
MQNEVALKIKGQIIKMAVDGLTELELGEIAAQVEKKIDEIEAKTGLADTSKLSKAAAMSFAIELHSLKLKRENDVEAEGRAIDGMASALEGALDKKLF